MTGRPEPRQGNSRANRLPATWPTRKNTFAGGPYKQPKPARPTTGVRPRRSNFQTISISPCSNCFRQRLRAGRLRVGPLLPSSTRVLFQPALLSAVSCKSGLWSSVETRAYPYFIKWFLAAPPSCKPGGVTVVKTCVSEQTHLAQRWRQHLAHHEEPGQQ